MKRLSISISVLLIIAGGLTTRRADSDESPLVIIKPSQLISAQWREVALAALNRAAALYGLSNAQQDTATRELAAFSMINIYQYTGRDLYLSADGHLVDDNHNRLFATALCSK